MAEFKKDHNLLSPDIKDISWKRANETATEVVCIEHESSFFVLT